MYAPVVGRLCIPTCARRERVALVTLLGMGLYLVKVLHSPTIFTEHDELIHVRTAGDILRTHHLFHKNPVLPVSSLYPGMEIITTALVKLSRLPFFACGVIVIAAARLVTILAMYLFVESVGRSSQVAGLATALYMANPNFLFFDSMFKYESVALAFAAFTLFALARSRIELGDTRKPLTFVAVLALGATVITHHITAYLLAGVLVVWAAAAWHRRRTEPGWMGLAAVAALAILLNAAWFVSVAQVTYGYLSNIFGPAVTSVGNLIMQEFAGGQSGGVRGLFSSSEGYVAPIWERITAISAAGLILASLPFGLLEVWNRRRAIRSIGLIIGLSSIAYPASLALRFTGAAWETSNRSSEFIFVAVGFALSLALVRLWLRSRWRWQHSLPVVVCASLIFMGGVIAGWTPQFRMPGPYIPLAATARGIDPQTLDASRWVLSYLGPEKLFGADDLNSLVLASYGRQNISSTINGGQNPNWILLAQYLGPTQLGLLRASHIQYLLVDDRVADVPGVAAGYYPLDNVHLALRKFARIGVISQVYGSGAIQIYDVRALSGAH